ncbi:MAG: AtpZ/AtpI family protein [Pseudomonadota bacterium]
MKKETKRLFKDLSYFSGLGISVVLATVIGLGIGYYLDNHVFDTSPWFTLIFLGFGIAAGFRNIYLAMKKSREL